MKALIVSIALLFAAGCAMQSVSIGGPVRYECYTHVDSNHVLTLPIPETDAATQHVEITFQGVRIPTIYQRDGLTQLWILEDSLYIQVDPDFDASYMDFRDAEEGERRAPEARFECKKHK
jgi:hypothetical protein